MCVLCLTFVIKYDSNAPFPSSTAGRSLSVRQQAGNCVPIAEWWTYSGRDRGGVSRHQLLGPRTQHPVRRFRTHCCGILTPFAINSVASLLGCFVGKFRRGTRLELKCRIHLACPSNRHQLPSFTLLWGDGILVFLAEGCHLGVSPYVTSFCLKFFRSQPYHFSYHQHRPRFGRRKGRVQFQYQCLVHGCSRHRRFIGFKNWSQPFADSYLGMEGHKARFLGFWTVMMQAFFSFSGSEIAGIVSSLSRRRITFPTDAI